MAWKIVSLNDSFWGRGLEFHDQAEKAASAQGIGRMQRKRAMDELRAINSVLHQSLNVMGPGGLKASSNKVAGTFDLRVIDVEPYRAYFDVVESKKKIYNMVIIRAREDLGPLIETAKVERGKLESPDQSNV